MKTLFVTATAQTLANYHTIWHLANHKTDIDHIVIISTEFSRKKNFVANLMALLQNNVQFEQNFAVSELFLPNGIEENNLFEIKKLIHDWLIAHQPKSVIFNVTGGTKLISIAQDQLALQYRANTECIYQNMKGELVWYLREDPKKSIFKISQPSDIQIYLAAYGYQKLPKETSLLKLPAKQLEYILTMLSFLQADFDKACRLVTVLNGCCAKNDKKQYPYYAKVDNPKIDYSDWLTNLSNLPNAYFEYDSLNQTIRVDSEENLYFVMGNWFEVLVGYQYLMAFDQKIDIHASVNYTLNKMPNEIDVAFIHGGYFYYVECKTIKWNKADGIKDLNRNISHLDSTGDVAGLGSKKVFVSLYPVPDKVILNAHNKNIHIIHGKAILDPQSFKTD